jgi:magnesium-transporting ATPase (P-type)
MGENAKVEIDQESWHASSADDVVKRLATDARHNLDTAEAASRLRQYGPNRLPEGKKKGSLLRFLGQFNNILVYVLLVAAFTKLMLSLWLDAGIIFAVVVLNALLGFIQEGRAEKALDSIRNMLSAEARTLRGGETRMIPAEQLVPGDIALLESGDRIPADLRLIDVKNLRTEEAALTGESVPTEKTTNPASAKATVGDRVSIAFCGTMVVSGRAVGVVVGTGSDTELGRINQLLSKVSALETPLLRQIKKFGYAITAAIQRHHLFLWPLARPNDVRRAVPGGRRHCGVAHPRGPASPDHHHPSDRRAAHGATQCHHPPAAGGRDAWLGVAHLLR